MSIRISDFAKASDGRMIRVAVLKNDRIEAHILTLGATVQSLLVPDRKGRATDVVLGFTKPQHYEMDDGCLGAVCGRFAGRIKGAQFPLYEELISVTQNDGENCLHSGLHGFHRQVFDIDIVQGEADTIVLRAESPDGTDGFPGNVSLEVRYSLVSEGLVMEYTASTDAPTVCNITNHAYFNLNGHNSGNVLGHRLSLDAKYFLELDETNVPTGRKVPVADTPMDFNEEKTIGRDIGADYAALQQCRGYDHCYAIRESGLRHAAWLTGPETGIRMELLTTAPGVQLYTANYLNPPANGKDDTKYQPRDGVCLEAQDFPNAPNIPSFPDTTLLPDEPYSATTIWRFDIAEE